ncbi:IS200/IS605 family transposase, partial [Limnospira fusiformis CCALA 023]
MYWSVLTIARSLVDVNPLTKRASVSDLKIHLVCVTKYRSQILTVESLMLILKSFREVAEKMNFQVLEF